jgi:hypothetical protein
MKFWRACILIIYHKKSKMASINFGSYKVEIVINNIDGVFNSLFGLSIPRRYWVLLTVEDNNGEKETFPRIDENMSVKTFDTYDEAIDDIAFLLKKRFGHKS